MNKREFVGLLERLTIVGVMANHENTVDCFIESGGSDRANMLLANALKGFFDSVEPDVIGLTQYQEIEGYRVLSGVVVDSMQPIAVIFVPADNSRFADVEKNPDILMTEDRISEIMDACDFGLTFLTAKVFGSEDEKVGMRVMCFGCFCEHPELLDLKKPDGEED